MTKFDPYRHQETYHAWKALGMPLEGILEANAVLIRQYILDMEVGANVNGGG